MEIQIFEFYWVYMFAIGVIGSIVLPLVVENWDKINSKVY